MCVCVVFVCVVCVVCVCCVCVCCVCVCVCLCVFVVSCGGEVRDRLCSARMGGRACDVFLLLAIGTVVASRDRSGARR